MVEAARKELLTLLNSTVSDRQKLLGIAFFFLSVEEQCAETEKPAYFSEFEENYHSFFGSFSPIGMEPGLTDFIITQYGEMLDQERITRHHSSEDFMIRAAQAQSSFNDILEGNAAAWKVPLKPYFPLLEESTLHEVEEPHGFLDSISVTLKKNDTKDSIAVYPTMLESDKALERQVEASLNAALGIAREYIGELSPYHTVSVHFDEHFSYYSGDSMGLALTISIISELMELYNASYTIATMRNCVFTGSVSTDGELEPVGIGIVQSKLKAVFYSFAEVFIIHLNDLPAAREALKSLQFVYPNRKLELVGVTSVSDILNRRNVIEIRKKSLLKRSARVLRKGWVQVAIILIPILITGFYLLREMDDNPVRLELSRNIISIVNSTGRELMRCQTPVDIYERQIKMYVNLIDVNNDGKNEILLTREENNWLKQPQHFGRVALLDKDSLELWSYKFTDTASSVRETLEPSYTIRFIGFVTYNSRKTIVLIATNNSSFAGSVFMLDAQTGRRVGGTYWQSGHIAVGILHDYNGDGIQDVIVGGNDNGFENATLTAISIDRLEGMRSSTADYEIRFRPHAEILFYFRFPPTDYAKHLGLRHNGFNDYNLLVVHDYLQFFILEDYFEKAIGYTMRYHLKEKYFSPFMHDHFRVARDSLVAKGLLSPPYTDTKEYLALLKNQVLSWDGEKWVKYHQEEK